MGRWDWAEAASSWATTVPMRCSRRTARLSSMGRSIAHEVEARSLAGGVPSLGWLRDCTRNPAARPSRLNPGFGRDHPWATVYILRIAEPRRRQVFRRSMASLKDGGASVISWQERRITRGNPASPPAVHLLQRRANGSRSRNLDDGAMDHDSQLLLNPRPCYSSQMPRISLREVSIGKE